MSVADFLRRHGEVAQNKIFLDYIQSRGLTYDEIAPYRLGFYKQNKADEQTYQIPWFFKDSIIFPVFDEMLQPIGFELRNLQKKMHFKWFHPKARYIFFGFTPAAAKAIYETEEVFLIEGTFDAMSFQLWRPNVLSVMTNNITDEQWTFLRRYVKRAYLCFDVDKWGLINKKKTLQQRENDRDVTLRAWKYLQPSDEVNDANKYLQVYGKDRLIHTLELRWKMARL